MHFISRYDSPLGQILLAADETALTGLWFAEQKHFARTLPSLYTEQPTPVLCDTCRWLDRYFAGQIPGAPPALHPTGTAFQRQVWDILLSIPYGQTQTYGEIANQLAQRRGLAHMSAQAVGNAVGRNPISILIPCHRVVGANGALTGYAGGIHRKEALLLLEAMHKKTQP